jgi:hypothetical protein
VPTYRVSITNKVVHSLGTTLLSHWLSRLIDATNSISMVDIILEVPMAHGASLWEEVLSGRPGDGDGSQSDLRDSSRKRVAVAFT